MTILFPRPSSGRAFDKRWPSAPPLPAHPPPALASRSIDKPMGHLDAELFIEELWGAQSRATGDRHPKKDGWPVFRTQYHVASFRQDVRVHSYMCEATKERAHDCRDADLSAGQLMKLARLLKRFAADPKAMVDYEDFMSDTLFGWQPGTEGYYADRKRRMAEATALAKKIRKAAKYIKKRKQEEDGSLQHAWVYAVYRAHW